MANALQVQDQPATMALGEFLGLEAGAVWAALQNVAPPEATADDIMNFIVLAGQYKLNPLANQIYLVKTKHGVKPVVPIDGWVAIANRHDQFDGMVITADFAYDEEADDYYTEVAVYRKDRKHPTVLREWYSECKRDTAPWQMKKRMMRHKAISQAKRVAFAITGIYEPDEAERMGAIDAYHSTQATVIDQGQAVADSLAKELAADASSGAGTTGDGNEQAADTTRHDDAGPIQAAAGDGAGGGQDSPATLGRTTPPASDEPLAHCMLCQRDMLNPKPVRVHVIGDYQVCYKCKAEARALMRETATSDKAEQQAAAEAQAEATGDGSGEPLTDVDGTKVREAPPAPTPGQGQCVACERTAYLNPTNGLCADCAEHVDAGDALPPVEADPPRIVMVPYDTARRDRQVPFENITDTGHNFDCRCHRTPFVSDGFQVKEFALHELLCQQCAVKVVSNLGAGRQAKLPEWDSGAQRDTTAVGGIRHCHRCACELKPGQPYFNGNDGQPYCPQCKDELVAAKQGGRKPKTVDELRREARGHAAPGMASSGTTAADGAAGTTKDDGNQGSLL